MKALRKKLVYVEPLLTPYSAPRFAALARDPQLEIVILLEKDQFPSRPGWASSQIPGCTVEVVGSQLIYERVVHRDLGYDVTDIRSIPWRLPLALRRHRPEVVIVGNATELLLALAARAFGWFEIALDVEDTRHTFRHSAPFRAFLKQCIYRRADLYLAFSEQSEEYLKSIGVTKAIVRTSWSVDLASFTPDSVQRVSIRGRLKLTDRAVFLFVGQFIPRKGLMPMLRAWSRLAPQYRAQMGLVLVGDGPLKEEAHQFVREYKLDEVHFIGHLSYAEMPAYYAAADVFLLPTLQDVWGIVVLEAMASGCAVMTTKYCGASYLVNHGINGWLLDSANESSIQASLVEAVRARSELAAMGTAARSSVKNFDTAKVMSSLASILKQP